MLAIMFSIVLLMIKEMEHYILYSITKQDLMKIKKHFVFKDWSCNITWASHWCVLILFLSQSSQKSTFIQQAHFGNWVKLLPGGCYLERPAMLGIAILTYLLPILGIPGSTVTQCWIHSG